MATVLENYYTQKKRLDNQGQNALLPIPLVWEYQELLYRISVMEACRSFVLSAPVTVDCSLLVNHYRLVDAYMQSLSKERRLGLPPTPEQQKQRDTALHNLEQVIQSYQQHFAKFCPTSNTQYKTEIEKVITTVLPAWTQYRSSYVELNQSKEGN